MNAEAFFSWFSDTFITLSSDSFRRDTWLIRKDRGVQKFWGILWKVQEKLGRWDNTNWGCDDDDGDDDDGDVEDGDDEDGDEDGQDSWDWENGAVG